MENASRAEPAATVIEILGGIDDTAKVVGRHRSVVNKWLRPKQAGGTDGSIPPKHWPALISANPAKINLDLLRGLTAGKVAA